jgi:hypothetical protein
MTTAGQTTNRGNKIAGTTFDFGAGHVNGAGALDPGLVYNITDNWTRFICAIQPDPMPAGVVCTNVCTVKTCGSVTVAAGVNLPSFSLPNVTRGASIAAPRELTYVGNLAKATFFGDGRGAARLHGHRRQEADVHGEEARREVHAHAQGVKDGGAQPELWQPHVAGQHQTVGRAVAHCSRGRLSLSSPNRTWWARLLPVTAAGPQIVAGVDPAAEPSVDCLIA